MEAAAPDRAAALTRQVERLGLGAVAVLALASAGLLWLALDGEVPALGLALPAAGLVLLVGALARPGPTATFALVAAASAALLGGEAGVSAFEALFGLGAMGYLAAWTGRAVLAGEGVLRSSADLAAALWCVLGIAGGAALGALFGADIYDFRADVQAALFFPFYFPAKEIVRRAEHGPLVLGGVILWLGLVAVLLNLIGLRSALSSATQAYEVVDVRVAAGMMQMTAASLVTLAALATPRPRGIQAVLLAILGTLLVGLVVGKSRAFWVAVALGMALLGGLLRGTDRRRLVLALGLGTVCVVGIGVVAVGDQVALIGAGALDRLMSLAEGRRDLSLATRFAETQAAMDRVAQNPVLGHGWGVQVTHYSLVSAGTRSWAFLHNGYVALWFKLGLWGLGLMLVTWLATLARGLWALWTERLETDERALLAGSVATLAVLLLTASTSNPFSIMDQMLLLGLLLGGASGVAQRAQDRRLRGA